MNRLLHTLRDFDDCRVDRYSGQPEVSWTHPLDREHCRQLDWVAVDRLIAAGFLSWEYDSLSPTARGWRLIHFYRPLSYRGFPPASTYRNWTINCRRFPSYLNEQESIHG